MDSLRYDGPSVVVCHDVLRTDHDIVAGLDRLACRMVDRIALDDLFDDRLGDARRGGDRRKASRANEAPSCP